MTRSHPFPALALAATLGLSLVAPASFSTAVAEECNAAGTVGSGGSASAGDTSASTVGTAGACVTDDGTNASIASGGSAAAADGKTQSRTNVSGSEDNLKAQSKAQAMDKGTFSKSKTKTSVKDGSLESSTKTMSHVPGEKPVMEKSSTQTTLPAN